MLAGPRVVGSVLYMYRSHFVAQVTSWAVTVTQAFVVAPCVAVVLLRLFGLGLRFGVAVRPVRGSCRGCYDLGAAVGSVWGIVVCVVFRFRRVLRRIVLVSWLWLSLATARKRSLKRNTAMDGSIGAS